MKYNTIFLRIIDLSSKALIFYIWILPCFTQELIYGKNQYTAYQLGQLPIIISVPHGGLLAPSHIPDRACPGAVTATDLNTQLVALEVSNAIYQKTGCYPYIIYCHLKRTKLDCNRNLSDGSCGNIDAEIAWEEYHQFIREAIRKADEEFGFNTFFVDLHGHGKPSQRIELGYLLDEQDLENTDLLLNTSALIDNSSLRNLALQNKNDLKHAALLRGLLSFGTLLHDKGYPTVPSSQIPSPDGDNTYFNGGYITANYTSFNPEFSTNGFQIELNYSGIRNNSDNIKKFGDAMADVLLEYMYSHREILTNSCKPASLVNANEHDLRIWFQPETHCILIEGNETKEITYEIYHIDGKLISSGKTSNSVVELPIDIKQGLYLIQLRKKETILLKAFKFAIL